MLSLQFSPDVIYKYIKGLEKSNDLELLLAFVHFNNIIERFAWKPVYVYKYSYNLYFHVHLKHSFMCKKCGHIHYGTVLIPLKEYDSAFYTDADYKNESIPHCFSKISVKIAVDRCKYKFVLDKYYYTN